MSAQMFLSCESLSTDLTRIRPLSCVASDVPLQNALLFGRVRAEWTFVQPPCVKTNVLQTNLLMYNNVSILFKNSHLDHPHTSHSESPYHRDPRDRARHPHDRNLQSSPYSVKSAHHGYGWLHLETPHLGTAS